MDWNNIKSGFYKKSSTAVDQHGGITFYTPVNIYIYIYEDKKKLLIIAINASNIPENYIPSIAKFERVSESGNITKCDNNQITIETFSPILNKTGVIHGVFLDNNNLYLKEEVEDESTPHIDNLFTYIGFG